MTYSNGKYSDGFQKEMKFNLIFFNTQFDHGFVVKKIELYSAIVF